MINYNLIRSNRKSIAIYITKDASIEVRAPLKISKTKIDHFVASKQNWIEEHLEVRQQNLETKAAFELNYGSILLMQGKEYPITSKEGSLAGFDGKSFFLPPGLSTDAIKHEVVKIYKLAAKKLLKDKTINYAKQTGLTPASIKITGAKTRWGSCSGKGNICFSWRLIMADDDVIDYVVIHELAHIKEHNHSEKFWALVEQIIPDYKERQLKLKLLQKKLAKENWEDKN